MTQFESKDKKYETVFASQKKEFKCVLNYLQFN
jgi:hypothetical protein